MAKLSGHVLTVTVKLIAIHKLMARHPVYFPREPAATKNSWGTGARGLEGLTYGKTRDLVTRLSFTVGLR